MSTSSILLFSTALVCSLVYSQPTWRQIVEGDVRTIALGPSGWYAATGNHLLRSTDRGQRWDSLQIPVPFIGDFTSVVVEPGPGSIIFSAEPGVYRSTDQGVTWTGGDPKALGAYSLAVDPDGRIFASGSPGQLRSTDGGGSWDSVGSLPGPFTDGLLITPTGRVLASSVIGGLLASDDAGASWDSLQGLASPPGVVTAMAVSPTTNTLLVAVVHIHNTGAGAPLYRSTDNGTTWTVVDSGFVLLDALAADHDGTFYVGGNHVRRSKDDGLSWQAFGVGYPTEGHAEAIIPVDSLVFVCDRNQGILVLGPVSTGVNDREDVPTSPIVLQNFPNPFNSTTRISFRVSAPSGFEEQSAMQHIRLVIYDLLGREVAVLMDGFAEAREHEVRWEATSVTTGVYVAMVEVRYGGSSIVRERATHRVVLLR